MRINAYSAPHRTRPATGNPAEEDKLDKQIGDLMIYQNCTEQRFLRLPDVMHRVGISRSQIYALMKDGKFPQSFRLCERIVGWHEPEVTAWMATRVRTTH
jgi:prophage regulatory protein